jgi:hypothetical protein
VADGVVDGRAVPVPATMSANRSTTTTAAEAAVVVAEAKCTMSNPRRRLLGWTKTTKILLPLRQHRAAFNVCPPEWHRK